MPIKEDLGIMVVAYLFLVLPVSFVFFAMPRAIPEEDKMLPITILAKEEASFSFPILWNKWIVLDMFCGNNKIGDIASIMMFISCFLPPIMSNFMKEIKKSIRLISKIPLITIMISIIFIIGIIYFTYNYYDFKNNYPGYLHQELFWWFWGSTIISFVGLGLFTVLSSLVLISIYIQEKRAEKIRKKEEELKVTIKNIIISRGSVSFEDLSKEFRIKIEKIKKIIHELHSSQSLQGIFTKDGQGYITIKK